MSRPPSWASFTRPINAGAVKPAPPISLGVNGGGVIGGVAGYPHQPQYSYPFSHQPVATPAPIYPASVAAAPTLASMFVQTAAAPPPAVDNDASIRGLLADILGGGDGSNAKPIPAPQPAIQPSYYPQSTAGLNPPSSQVPPYNGVAYSNQYAPHPAQYANQVVPSAPQQFMQQQQQQHKGRQLITLSGPNVLTLSNTGINNNVNGYHHNQLHQHQQQQQPQNPAVGGAVPIVSQPQNGFSSDSSSILRPGMKRKASDETLSTTSVNGNNPTADEEYKKSTKHFLYHCDVCNFTCQGPGIYYHIVSPKHKNLCQKLGRVFIEPKGVLVGARGPAKDRSGQDYQSVDGAGADPLEQDEGPYVEFYNFCKSLQIPSDLIPSGDQLANLRLPTAEPEPKDAQLAKLVSSIRASAAVVKDTNKTTSRNFRYWVSTFKEQQKEKEMKKVIGVKGAEPFQFKIVNYNVLAQAMMTEQSYNFQQHNPDHLDWEHRSKCIKEELDYIGDPEIICLQEVASDVYSSFFVPLLEMRGYLGMFRCRQSGVAEGCAIFVRLDKFRFIDAHPISLKRDSPILDRENVGLMVKVKPIVQRPKNIPAEKWKEPDAHLCIVTTQLTFSAQRGDTKLAQLGLMFAEMDKFCRRSETENSYYPTIFSGDLNALPYSSLYKFVQGKRLKYSGLQADEVSGQTNMFTKDRKEFLSKPLFPAEVGVTENCQFGEAEAEPTGELTHPFKFVTVYKHEIAARERDPNDDGEIEIKNNDRREISTQIKGFSTCTDYMFYSVDGFRVSHNIQTGRMVPQDVLEGPLRIIARHRIPVLSEMKDIGLIPNATDGSDHFPMAAEFLLNPWTFTR